MIRVLAVGKLKDRRLAELIAEYARRIRPLAPFELTEVRDGPPERVRRDLLGRLGPATGHGLVIALDERGEAVSSRELADLLGRHGSLDFLVGSAEGLDSAVRERADRALRLSRLTLTHEMARLLLVEQIYRGLTILRGMPYHRG
jgi:23S rRNA (pseudouridine1915-N3)-methyltransferase